MALRPEPLPPRHQLGELFGVAPTGGEIGQSRSDAHRRDADASSLHLQREPTGDVFDRGLRRAVGDEAGTGVVHRVGRYEYDVAGSVPFEQGGDHRLGG